MSSINVNTIKSRLGGPPTLPSGVVVSAAATFNNDVSIGGTLTYEDVTNVDVVGLITARGGIKFGAAGIGGTIAANGNTTLAGVVTATGGFSGDGSGLTNLVGTGVTNNVNTVNLNVISGVSTFNNNVTLAAGNLDVDAGQLLVGSNVLIGPAGVATFSGTGDVHLKDSVKLLLGTASGGDCQLLHDGSDTFVQNKVGDLKIANNVGGDVGGNIIIQAMNGENSINCVHDAQVELSHNGTKKFETTGYGVTVGGGACLSGLTTAFGGLTVAGTMVESMSSTTTAYNTSGDLNITNGNFHFNSANLGGTGTTLNIMSTAGINTTTKVNQVLNVTAVTAVNASTAFVNKVTVDGKATGITTHWVGGEVPSDGGGSGVDTYSFNILKTGSETYIIVANQVKTSS